MPNYSSIQMVTVHRKKHFVQWGFKIRPFKNQDILKVNDKMISKTFCLHFFNY